jgi:integrase
MLSLYKRGRVWWARGSVRGQRIRRSLDTQFKEEAGFRLRDLERELYSGRRVRPFPWNDFAHEFLTWKSPQLSRNSEKKYQFVLNRFGGFLGTANLQTVSPLKITHYMTERRRDVHPTRKIPVGDEGIKSDLRILHSAFAYAVRAGYLEANPVQVPKLNTLGGKTQPFTREEVARMLASCDTRSNVGHPYRLKPVILTFLHTGLRISDVVALRKADVDLKAGQLVVKTRKRGRVVSLPLHPDLALALQPLVARGDCPLLFHTFHGKPLTSLDAYLRRLWKQGGIVRARAHRFRDTFSVRLLEAGASLYDVAQLLGISVAVCEKSYAPYVKELRDRARRLIFGIDLNLPKK